MQGNQNNWRLMLAISALLTSALVLGQRELSQFALAQQLAATPKTTPKTTVEVPSAASVANPLDDSVDDPTVAIAQLPSENRVDQATTLLIVMIGAFVLVLGMGVVLLWSLRKSVVNEVATIVRTQLNEMTELENKVHSATRSLNRILADADDLSGDLKGRSSHFQKEVIAQREVLAGLVKELNAFKHQTAKNWEKQLEDINQKLEATATDFAGATIELKAQAQQRLAAMNAETAVESQRILQRFTTSESEFSRHVGVIKEETQRRKTAFFDEIERKESVLSDQLGSLQAQALAEQDRVLSTLVKAGNEFGPKLSEVEAAAKAKIEAQRDQALDSLKASETAAIQELEEIQVSALGHRELALQNIQRSTEELQQQFNAIRSEVESRKADMMQSFRQSADGFLTQFATLKADVEGRKGTILGDMDRVATGFKQQIASLQAGVNEERSHTIMQLQSTAEGFRAQLANLGTDLGTRKSELYNELTTTARTFSEQLAAVQGELGALCNSFRVTLRRS
ncbi:MAG: hypothetical protein DCF15_09610 [Phormidesmis priestleyi]|uniref:Uncharacterized protein n=1 Tax=Phormidesmis priestleyi TaxID=268141 RepID=A0A2W4XFL8_9CYAN|nr:MAG: hypothetical protein DCF15_09610 [Phormidesmis priestleyi]